jgi:hypothetical protein
MDIDTAEFPLRATNYLPIAALTKGVVEAVYPSFFATVAEARRWALHTIDGRDAVAAYSSLQRSVGYLRTICSESLYTFDNKPALHVHADVLDEFFTHCNQVECMGKTLLNAYANLCPEATEPARAEVRSLVGKVDHNRSNQSRIEQIRGLKAHRELCRPACQRCTAHRAAVEARKQETRARVAHLFFPGSRQNPLTIS